MLDKDKEIIIELAKQIEEIAELPEQKLKKEKWTKVNDLKSFHPTILVWEEELPWDEIYHLDELKLVCENDIAREQERYLRKKLFMWKYFRGDMIVEPVVNIKPVYIDSMFGISEKGETICHNSMVNYVNYQQQIFDSQDLSKIQLPRIEYSIEENKKFFDQLVELYDGHIHVNLGISRFNFSAWHFIIKWLGSEAFYRMISNNKKLLHEIIERVTEGYISRLAQLEENGMILNNIGNFICGSGGLSYISGSNLNSKNLCEMWGSTTSQVFQGTSPNIQRELGVEYEKKWLEKFAYTYYGCCEILSDRIDILRDIKNLRKISISPWCNVDEAIECIGKDYVLSYKINPTKFINSAWSISEEKREFRELLKRLIKCPCEIIIKDVSTFGKDWTAITQWLEMAKIEIESV